MVLRTYDHERDYWHDSRRDALRRRVVSVPEWREKLWSGQTLTLSWPVDSFFPVGTVITVTSASRPGEGSARIVARRG